MRCKSCNVDLSEGAKKCPLCGEIAVNEEPVLQGLQTAYYPKVKYKKPMPNFNLIFVIVWLLASLGVFIFDLLFSKGDYTYSLFTVILIPCIWSLMLRPMYTSKYYFGKYLLTDLVFLIPWIIVLFRKMFGDFKIAFSLAVPALLVAALLIIMIEALFVKKDRTNAPVFIILICIISIIMLVISLFIKNIVWQSYFIPITFSVFVLVLMWALEPKKVGQELKARLHF